MLTGGRVKESHSRGESYRWHAVKAIEHHWLRDMFVMQIETDIPMHRKRTRIELAEPLITQSSIGFEDRAAHQSRKRFQVQDCMAFAN